MNRVNLLGTHIDNLCMTETLERVSAAIENNEFRFAITPNVDHLMRVRHDACFREIYAAADLVVADGVPLVWASRMLGTPLKERVNGTDLFENTCALAGQRGYSVYLLGGNPGAAAKAAARLKHRTPALNVAGWFCPENGFDRDPAQNLAIQDRIRKSGAHILFVALGAPKQERWIYHHARGCGVNFAVGIGISFSLVAGEVRRAPVWMQRGGLEWFWRLLVEPRRLWKRYLFDDMPFIAYVLRECLKKRRGAASPRGSDPVATASASRSHRVSSNHKTFTCNR